MTVSLQDVFLLPLALQFLALAILAWAYRKRSYRDQRIPKSNIYRCTECKKVYIDPRIVPLSKCPNCSTLNEAIRR